MIRCKKENIEWLEFSLLQDFKEVVHGIFLRPLNILTASKNLLGTSHLSFANQVHGNEVKIADPSKIEDCDGLITDRKDLTLLVKHADCQAALFYDPVKRVIGNIHCGWKGSVQNIYQKTVEKFREIYGSNPKDLRVCISPSLGPDHAEFIHYEIELPKEFWSFQVKPSYFDFWAISRMQLLESGIEESHIEMAKMCTFCGETDFFSYRRDKKTGRHGTLIALNID